MEIQNKSSDIIYHYTSIDALYEILVGHSFRLTNLQSSNDMDELYFDSKRFQDLIKSRSLLARDKITTSFVDELFNSISVIKTRKLPPCNVYSISFTDVRDSLYHWKMYANNMSGVCLGIKERTLKKHTKNIIEGGDLFHVAYSDDMFEESWAFVVKEFAYSIFKYICSEDEHEYEKYLNDCGEEIATIFLHLARVTKKKRFFNIESEIRMMFVPQPTKAVSLTNEHVRISEGACAREKFMVTKNGIRQFITMDFNNKVFDEIVSEIILGPHCTQNPDELKAFLRENKLSQINVKRSDIKII